MIYRKAGINIMANNDTAVMEQIARRHESRPEEVLMRMASIAMRAVDVICEACQGKIDASFNNGIGGLM